MIRAKRKPPIIRNNLEHHHCTKCGEYKPVFSFYKSGWKDGATQSRCKVCYAASRNADGEVRRNKRKELSLAWSYIREDVTRMVIANLRQSGS